MAASGGGTERRVKLRVLVDSSSVEVFGGDGTAAITSLVFPDPSSTGLSFSTSGGNARLVSAKVHQLADTARLTAAPPSAVFARSNRHRAAQPRFLFGGSRRHAGKARAQGWPARSTRTPRP